MYSEILYLIKTGQDQDEFCQQLENLREALYKKEGEFEKVLETVVRKDLAREIKKVVSGQQDKISFLKDLEREIKKLRKLSLILSYYPSEVGIDRISEWVYQNISKDIVIDISIDKSLLGGAVIEFEGKYIDLSLKKKLDEYFLLNKQKILRLENP